MQSSELYGSCHDDVAVVYLVFKAAGFGCLGLHGFNSIRAWGFMI